LFQRKTKSFFLFISIAAAFGKLQELGDATGQDELTVSKVVESV